MAGYFEKKYKIKNNNPKGEIMKKQYLLAAALLGAMVMSGKLKADLRRWIITNTLKVPINVWSSGFDVPTNVGNSRKIRPGQKRVFWATKKGGVKKPIFIVTDDAMQPGRGRVDKTSFEIMPGVPYRFIYSTPTNAVIHKWKPLEGFKKLKVARGAGGVNGVGLRIKEWGTAGGFWSLGLYRAQEVWITMIRTKMEQSGLAQKVE